jgi:hypothetical protein
MKISKLPVDLTVQSAPGLFIGVHIKVLGSPGDASISNHAHGPLVFMHSWSVAGTAARSAGGNGEIVTSTEFGQLHVMVGPSQASRADDRSDTIARSVNLMALS